MTKQPTPIYPRICKRCGWGPYVPRKPESVDCPRCHMPYNTDAVRNTRPTNGQKGNNAKAKIRGAAGTKGHSRRDRKAARKSAA